MNCTLTFISGDEFAQQPGILVYLDTLVYVPGDKFVFTHDLNQENRARIASHGITVVDVDDIQWLVRDRFRVYGDFLAKNNYQNVLLTDAKDVLFTSNPFEFLEEQKKPLILVSEGITHAQSLWNLIDQTGLQNKMRPVPTFERWPVINGGVQLGSRMATSQFCWDIYQCMIKIRPDSTEQAMINYLYQVYYKEKIGLADPHEDWLCCTGEPIFRNIHNYSIELDTWRNPHLVRPFSIVHQWERVKQPL